MLPISIINPSNIGDAINKMNKIIYDYFKNTYGSLNNIQQSQWKDKYESMHKIELKLCLRTLKRNQTPYNEVKCISHLLRSKINKSDAVNITVSKIYRQISEILLSYIKHSFDNKTPFTLERVQTDPYQYGYR